VIEIDKAKMGERSRFRGWRGALISA